MLRALCAGAALFVCSCFENVSAESLYLTAPPSTYTGARPSYVFIAPYSTRVATTLSASVSKTTTSSNDNSNSKGSSNTNQPVQAQILSAKWTQTVDQNGNNVGVITYSVSCDLTTVLVHPVSLDVAKAQPKEFNASGEVIAVTPYTIVMPGPPQKPATNYSGGAEFSGVYCPAASSPVTIALTITPTPISRAYLYLRRHPFFDDSVNVGVGSDGLLSSSNTSSTQEITAILTELAETAASFVSPALAQLPLGAKNYTTADLLVRSPKDRGSILQAATQDQKNKLVKKLPDRYLSKLLDGIDPDIKKIFEDLAKQFADERKEQETLNSEAPAVCYSAIYNAVKSGPIYDAIEFTQIDQQSMRRVINAESPPVVVDPGTLPKACRTMKGRPQPWSNGCFVERNASIVWTMPIDTVSSDDTVKLIYTLMTRARSYTQIVSEDTENTYRNGLVAFFPVPATVTITCEVDRKAASLPPDHAPLSHSVMLAAPSVVSLYTESHFLDPQRDFLSNPQDNITFSGGIITGHQFAGQSPAKTVVDTLTAPIRSLMPSVQQTTQVQVNQSTGATTTTKSTQVSAPKGP